MITFAKYNIGMDTHYEIWTVKIEEKDQGKIKKTIKNGYEIRTVVVNKKSGEKKTVQLLSQVPHNINGPEFVGFTFWRFAEI
jgi:hypothetical protein